MVGQSLPVRAPAGPIGTRVATPEPSAGRRLLNLAAFQAAWLITVIGAARGLGWAGPVAVGAAVALHLRLSTRPRLEFGLLAVALAMGAAVENGLQASGLTRYPGDPAWTPLWMLTLWPLLATTLNVSLSWFKTHLALAALLGCVAGPLAYRAGAALGAIELPDPVQAMSVLGLVWAVAFPILLVAARRLGDPPGGVGRH
jgi:hypothetical protein